MVNWRLITKNYFNEETIFKEKLNFEKNPLNTDFNLTFTYVAATFNLQDKNAASITCACSVADFLASS